MSSHVHLQREERKKQTTKEWRKYHWEQYLKTAKKFREKNREKLREERKSEHRKEYDLEKLKKRGKAA